MKKIAVFICGTFAIFNLMAQFPPRLDDHMWRKKVVSRIDLTEKVNDPLVYAETNIYTKGVYGETHGIVNALINCFHDGKYIGYKPDSLTSPMTYDDFVNSMNQINGGTSSSSSGLGGDESGGDEGGDEGSADDEFGGEETDDSGSSDVVGGSGGDDSRAKNQLIAPLETVLEIIEDRIFDKNRSDMYYDIQYIRLVWIDPSGAVPDKNVICFNYKDVMGCLEDTQWKNRFNDAEYRNMREIVELRLFHSYVVNVSGWEPNNLQQSDLRKNQMVEYEHHLWCY